MRYVALLLAVALAIVSFAWAPAQAEEQTTAQAQQCLPRSEVMKIRNDRPGVAWRYYSMGRNLDLAECVVRKGKTLSVTWHAGETHTLYLVGVVDPYDNRDNRRWYRIASVSEVSQELLPGLLTAPSAPKAIRVTIDLDGEQAFVWRFTSPVKLLRWKNTDLSRRKGYTAEWALQVAGRFIFDFRAAESGNPEIKRLVPMSYDPQQEEGMSGAEMLRRWFNYTAILWNFRLDTGWWADIIAQQP